MSLLVNISYNGTHEKGIGQPIEASVHARWLLECVHQWTELCDLVVVSITGFPGIVHCTAGLERDSLWHVWHKTKMVTMPHIPGHQQGAGWTIRMGLEAAGKCGYHYMLHTAEDVVPKPGVVGRYLDKLNDGFDYIGERWSELGLNAQFFACRVQALAPIFDPCVLNADRCTERYMAEVIQPDKAYCGQREYWHSHNYDEWRRFVEESHGLR